MEPTHLRRSRLVGPAFCLVIIMAGILVYCRALPYPFIFDDEQAITDNPHIRRLWPLAYAMSAPAQSAVSGRPMVSLSLAVNYYFGGLDPWGYRAFNIAVHILAGLTLFGILRRTFVSPKLVGCFGDSATWLAGIAALLWLLHPLQTESVTYVTQRCESMMGLFYLLTLYCAIRGFASARAAWWYAAAVGACALGMGTKEVMATAPLMVLLYDWTFASASLRQALRVRWLLYAALAATGIIIGVAVAGGARSGSAGFGLGEITTVEYARSQFGVILHYLRLSIWPDSLCLDYDWPVADGLGQIVPPLLVVLLLLAATVWAVLRRSPLGYLGAWFFIILSPTSSVVPILDLAFEHRMYLPLAAICVLTVAGAYLLVERMAGYRPSGRRVFRGGAVLAAAVVIALLGVRTLHRNADYRSPIIMWTDVVTKRPENPRGQNNLGSSLVREERHQEAIERLQCALRLRPDWAKVHQNMGLALAGCGKVDEALEAFNHAIELEPENAEAHCNLANLLMQLGRDDQALARLSQAVELRPDYAEAHNNLGALLVRLGRNQEAIEQYQCALRLKPEWAELHQNLGLALAACGRLKEAAASYRRALELKPVYPEARYNMGNALLRLGAPDAAMEQYARAVRDNPDYFEAHFNLATMLRSRGDVETAAIHQKQAMRLALRQGELLRQQGRLTDAAATHANAAAMDPKSDEAHYRLGQDLLALRRPAEAAEAFRQALELNPDRKDAQQALEAATAQQDK